MGNSERQTDKTHRKREANRQTGMTDKQTETLKD
jgi:hypothetical protein